MYHSLGFVRVCNGVESDIYMYAHRHPMLITMTMVAKMFY